MPPAKGAGGVAVAAAGGGGGRRNQRRGSRPDQEGLCLCSRKELPFLQDEAARQRIFGWVGEPRPAWVVAALLLEVLTACLPVCLPLAPCPGSPVKFYEPPLNPERFGVSVSVGSTSGMAPVSSIDTPGGAAGSGGGAPPILAVPGFQVSEWVAARHGCQGGSGAATS